MHPIEIRTLTEIYPSNLNSALALDKPVTREMEYFGGIDINT
jgi:hypothetical protein